MIRIELSDPKMRNLDGGLVDVPMSAADQSVTRVTLEFDVLTRFGMEVAIETMKYAQSLLMRPVAADLPDLFTFDVEGYRGKSKGAKDD